MGLYNFAYFARTVFAISVIDILIVDAAVRGASSVVMTVVSAYDGDSSSVVKYEIQTAAYILMAALMYRGSLPKCDMKASPNGWSCDVSKAGESSGSGSIEVTDEVIRDAMKNAPLQTQQRAVSKPVIQNYVNRILEGEIDVPPIKVDGNIIVDGNHRYIASRITGIEIDTIQWRGGNVEKVISWMEIILDDFDWGNR